MYPKSIYLLQLFSFCGDQFILSNSLKSRMIQYVIEYFCVYLCLYIWCVCGGCVLQAHVGHSTHREVRGPSCLSVPMVHLVRDSLLSSWYVHRAGWSLNLPRFSCSTSHIAVGSLGLGWVLLCPALPRFWGSKHRSSHLLSEHCTH